MNYFTKLKQKAKEKKAKERKETLKKKIMTAGDVVPRRCVIDRGRKHGRFLIRQFKLTSDQCRRSKLD